ncbi:MAG: hypothetical protein P4L57_11340 [Rhizomicrobium sp.]|nr:hypothetical protein [Rhizomicrobium sp.]
MAKIEIGFKADQTGAGFARQIRKLCQSVRLKIQIGVEGSRVSCPILVYFVLIANGTWATEDGHVRIDNSGSVQRDAEGCFREALLARQGKLADIENRSNVCPLQTRDEAIY